VVQELRNEINLLSSKNIQIEAALRSCTEEKQSLSAKLAQLANAAQPP
jgi:hypothetical protein